MRKKNINSYEYFKKQTIGEQESSLKMFQEIEDNVEKINTFVENYNRGEYIGFYQTEVDAIMKLINKLV